MVTDTEQLDTIDEVESSVSCISTLSASTDNNYSTVRRNGIRNRNTQDPVEVLEWKKKLFYEFFL